MNFDTFNLISDLPQDGAEVLLLISDRSVAIEHFAVVAWRMGKEWWTGIPGNYIRIPDDWEKTHWKYLETPST